MARTYVYHARVRVRTYVYHAYVSVRTYVYHAGVRVRTSACRRPALGDRRPASRRSATGELRQAPGGQAGGRQAAGRRPASIVLCYNITSGDGVGGRKCNGAGGKPQVFGLTES